MWQVNGDEQQAAETCSFCGKHRDQVGWLVEGPSQTAICNECVDLYREHLAKVAQPITSEKISLACANCGVRVPVSHHYCYNCGTKFVQEA